MKINRKKIIIILSIVLGFQLIIFLYFNLLSPESISKRNYKSPLVNGLKKDAVISIIISDSKESFTVEKKDGAWLVKTKEKYIPADTYIVNDYLDILAGLKKGVIVDKGDNQDNYKKYGFYEEAYLKVEVKTNNKKDFSVLIGKPGQARKTSYIRFKDEKKVREIQSEISTKTGNQPISWAKRTIFNSDIALSSVEKLEVSSNNLKWYKGEYSIQFVKDTNDKESKGKFEIFPAPKGKLKEYILENVVESCLGIYVYDYKIEGDVKDKEKLANVKMTLTDKSSYRLTVYKADKNDVGEYIITTDFNNYMYLVNETALNTFIKSPSDLVEK